MNTQNRQEIVFDKTRLAGEFDLILRLMREYENLLQGLKLEGEWREDTQKHLQSHLDTLTRSRASLRTFDLVQGLIRHVVTRLTTRSFRFSQAGMLPESGEGIAAAGQEALVSWSGDFAVLANHLKQMAQNAPAGQREKLEKFLEAATRLYEQLSASNVPETQKILAEINVLTSNSQTRELLMEVALIARDVYRSLVDMSTEVSLDSLADSPVGLTDAVEKLNGVIVRLEEAALENLDQIELLNSKSMERLKSLNDVVKSLRFSQSRLMQLKSDHPELSEELERIQDRLSDEVGGRVMSLRFNLEQANSAYMDLVASQGFHDLAGQTLRRTIAFIEKLEEQLLALIHQFKPALEPAIVEAEAHRHDGEAGEKKSQSEVDDLLGQLGF